MDRVRFGRVLGRGVRLAARTVYEAVDAATAPTPTSSPPPLAQRSVAVVPPTRSAARPAQRFSAQIPSGSRERLSQTMQAASAGSRAGIFSPVKRASRAVSLELTGSFFALFAFAFAAGMWRARAGLATGGPERQHFLVYAAVMLLFGYFAVSNFLKAKRLP